MIAGYFGGAVDSTIMRTVDVFFAFPSVLLAIVLRAVILPLLRLIVRRSSSDFDDRIIPLFPVRAALRARRQGTGRLEGEKSRPAPRLHR